MTTRINVSVGQEGLLERESLARQAYRTTLTRFEGQKRLETEARQKRQGRLATASSGSNATTAATSIGTGGSASIFPQYTPSFAANRTCVLGDSFGHHQVDTGDAQGGEMNSLEFVALKPLEPPTSEFKLINLSLPPSPMQLRNLRVVWVGVRESCFTYNARSWFGPNPTQTLRALSKFMHCGGIVIINTEHNTAPSPCSGGVEQLDADINEVFGTSIVQSQGSAESDGGASPGNPYDNERYGEPLPLPPVGHSLIDYRPPKANGAGLSDFMPKAIYTQTSGIFTGGITLYRAPSGESIAAFQKVGKGVLVRFADSNYFGENPVARSTEMYRDRYFDLLSGKMKFYDDTITTLQYMTSAGRQISVAEGLMEWQKSKVR